jgi:hypothetical protein
VDEAYRRGSSSLFVSMDPTCAFRQVLGSIEEGMSFVIACKDSSRNQYTYRHSTNQRIPTPDQMDLDEVSPDSYLERNPDVAVSLRSLGNGQRYRHHQYTMPNSRRRSYSSTRWTRTSTHERLSGSSPHQLAEVPFRTARLAYSAGTAYANHCWKGISKRRGWISVKEDIITSSTGRTDWKRPYPGSSRRIVDLFFVSPAFIDP